MTVTQPQAARPSMPSATDLQHRCPAACPACYDAQCALNALLPADLPQVLVGADQQGPPASTLGLSRQPCHHLSNTRQQQHTGNDSCSCSCGAATPRVTKALRGLELQGMCLAEPSLKCCTLTTDAARLCSRLALHSHHLPHSPGLTGWASATAAAAASGLTGLLQTQVQASLGWLCSHAAAPACSQQPRDDATQVLTGPARPV